MKNKIIKWKNLLLVSLLISSIFSLFTLCITVAIFDKLKILERKLFLIEKNIKP